MSQSSLQKTIEVMLLFGVHNSKSALLQKHLNDLAAKFETLQKEAEQTRKTISDMSRAALPVEQLEDKLADLDTQLEKVAKDARKTQSELGQLTGKTAYNIRDIGSKLNEVGGAMQNAGNALLSPIQGAITAYMEQQAAIKEAGGQMSESARQFSVAQKEMQSAYIRIGAVALEQLAPYMEDAAELLSKFADFVEQNPEVIEGIAKSGIILAGLGKIVSTAGQIAMIFGSLQGMGLLAEGGVLAGFIPALTAAAPAIGILIVGAILAELTRQGLNKLMGTDKSFGDIATSGKQLASMTDITGGPLTALTLAMRGLGFDEQAAKVLEFNKTIHGLGDAAEEAAPKVEKTAEEIAAAAEAEKKRADGLDKIAEAYQQYQAAEVEAAREFEDSKAKINEDANRAELEATRAHGEKVSSITTRYQEQIASAIASYQQQEAQAAQDYQTSRAQAMRDAGIEIQKIEQDHQKRLAELLSSHNERANDLIANRDALGLVKENQAYEKSRREEENNTNEEIAQRRADIALKLSDMAQAYAVERSRRAQEFQQKLADDAKQKEADLLAEKKAYAEETRKRNEDKQRQMKDLDTQFKEEARKRQNAMLASVNALSTEAELKSKYYALQLQDVERYMQQWRAAMTPTTTGERAEGGYTPYGIYKMGERGTEFVLNANTTRAAEKMIGGNLSQDRMLAGLSRSGISRANNITLQQTVHFNGENSAGNRAQLRTLIQTVALDAIDQVMVRR